MMKRDRSAGHAALPPPLAGEGVGRGLCPQARTPKRRKPSPGAWRRPLPQAGEVKKSPLVLDRNVHVLDLQLAHRLEHGPGDVRIDLDLEVVHALQRLMVFLA